MKDLYQTAPEGAIPKLHTQAYTFLKMLSSFNAVPKKSFFDVFGETMRSPLQHLRGDKCQHWNIYEVINEDGEPCYQLDIRHGSGDWELDQEARIERKLKYKKKSHKQAKLETKRLPKAAKELEGAIQEANAQQR